MKYRPRPRLPDIGAAYTPVETEAVVLVLLIVLLVLWLILTIVGFAINGLLWLAIIGIVLFIGTVAIGMIRRRALRR